MNQYMTKKAAPGWPVLLAENLVCIAAVLLIVFLLLTIVMGVSRDGLLIVPILIIGLVIAVLLAVVNKIVDCKRARVHARVITSALCVSEKGAIPFEELMKATRINKLEQVIAGLSGKGYIRNVAIIRSDVCLTDRVPQAAEN